MKKIIIFKQSVFNLDEGNLKFIQEFLGVDYLILQCEIEEYIYIKELDKE